MAEPEEEEKEQDIDVWVQLQAWAETRRKQIGMGAGIALVVGFILYTNSYMQAAKHAEAEAALFGLEKPAARGQAPASVKASEYLTVVDKFAGTPAAERALLLAAGALYEENKYPEAEKRFSQFLAEFPASTHAARARLGIAASKDAQNKYAEAIAAYEALGTSAAGSSEANQAKLAVALLYERDGKADQALRVYDELNRQNPPTVWSREASLRREELLQRNPTLVPAATAAPNAPGPLVRPAHAPGGTNIITFTNQPVTNAAPATNTAPSAKK